MIKLFNRVTRTKINHDRRRDEGEVSIIIRNEVEERQCADSQRENVKWQKAIFLHIHFFSRKSLSTHKEAKIKPKRCQNSTKKLISRSRKLQ
jgi:hypothetical protein